ncbi:MAG TPA: SLBB domain-containing protein, partial [Longimicrobiales bacterium]|nr:SLBB domain-containing protein [Longimicrobiales bacterium]
LVPLLGILLCVAAPRLEAQQQDTAALRRAAEQRLGRPISERDIIQRLRDSGMSRQEVQTRLRQMGYDPGLVDRYFDALEGRTPVQGGEASRTLLSALERMGLVARESPLDSLDIGDEARDPLDFDRDMEELPDSGVMRVFGRAVFARASAEFVPVTAGPVDRDYRVGPGDEVSLILTGNVELAYNLDVTREGFIVIPDVGRVSVNGRTLGELENVLVGRLSQVYAGVGTGAGASVFVEVSLGRLRTNQVYVIGEVARPSAYQVSAVASVFDALYQAGGPTDDGSFRRVEVRRGTRVVARVDLYDYLLRGQRTDIRLEQGDIVFVPPAEEQVTIQGSVRRPAIYELLPSEGLQDLIRYAGGFRGDAVVRRIQIDRIVPPALRQPGIDRTLVDVDLADVLSGPPVDLFDGDIVQLFAVSEQRRNRVILTGEVRRPGIYQWESGLTLARLLDRADGVEPSAFESRIHIYRWNEQQARHDMVRVSLDRSAEATLADRDSIVIFSQQDLRREEKVAIYGFVEEPGFFALAPGMSLKDLILAAGGFTHGADITVAHVAREIDPTVRTTEAARLDEVPLFPPMPQPAIDVLTEAASPYWLPSADEFVLRNGDHVFIRKAPGYEEFTAVEVSGEVLRPGTYVLRSRGERIVDMVQRAGGLTNEAYVPGVQLFREGKLVAVDMASALRDPTGHHNLNIEAGDSLNVPRYDPTVLVTGTVAVETRVPYQPGRPYAYYIERAGGFSKNADKGRITVTHQNGERSTVRRTLFIERRPEVR